VKTNPKKADQMLQDFNLKVIRSAEAATEALENELYTIRTTDIQKQIFFSNNKKKD
jgi:dipeptidase